MKPEAGKKTKKKKCKVNNKKYNFKIKNVSKTFSHATIEQFLAELSCWIFNRIKGKTNNYKTAGEHLLN